jgi:hypothetical protein
LSDEAVAKLLSDHKAEVANLRAEIEFLKQKAQAERATATLQNKAMLEAESTKIKLCEDTRVAEKLVYTKAIDRIGKQSEHTWWQSPYLHLVLGIILGAGSSIAVVQSAK